jgi:hypothetical protein
LEGALGGITGDLIGLGLPDLEAKPYEGGIKDGSILISVHTENSVEISKAKDIFKALNALDITSRTEATPPKSDKKAMTEEETYTR